MNTEPEHLHREIEELNAYKARCQQLQEALKEKDQWFSQVFRESSNANSLVTIKEFRFLDVNDAYLRLSGFQREELINHTADELALLADPGQSALIDKMLQEGAAASPIRLNVLTKQKKILTIMFAGIPLNIDGESCLFTTSVDITAQMGEADALRESEEKYRSLIENSLQGLAIFQHSRCVFCNNAYADIVGYSVPELLQLQEMMALIHPDERTILDERLQKLLKGEPVPPRYECRILRKNGESRWVETFASVIEYKGSPAIQLAHIDITERKRAEAAARESRDRLRLALQGSGMMIWDWNIQTGETTDDGQWLQTLGYEVGEIEPRVENWDRFLHPDDRARVNEAYLDHVEGKTPYFEIEYRRRHKSGRWVWVLDRGRVVVRDSAGRPLHAAGIHLDITERKQAFDQLRQIANEQKTILNTISTGICYVKERIVQWSNPAFANMFGYKAEDLPGEDTSIFYLYQTDYQMVAEKGYPLLAKGIAYSTEAPMKKKDGSLIWCSITGQALAEDVGQGSIWALTDITERRKTEEALRASEERFKRLVQNSNDIIAILDRNMIPASVGGPTEMVLGFAPEELIGKDSFQRVHPDDAEILRETLNQIMEHPGNLRRVECRYLHKNGSWISAEIVGSNLLQDPVVNGIVLNIRDISERKKLQEQLQQAIKMEAVGVLAGGVAHDFNNLLNVINGYCELLLDDLEVRDKKREEIELILQAGQRAASLTSQLLAFSRKQILQPVVLNLNDSITEMSAILRRLIGEDIKLASITQPGLGSIHADPGQIQQIIMNLAVNARDAMPQGGQLTIETANVDLDEEYFRRHPEGSPGPCVMLAISDNGIGMSAAVQERLFEPFFTTKEKGKGTGLGLSTVYGIVKQSNGLIWVYSEPGKGTTFKIYFPRLESKTAAAAVEKAPKSRFQGSETILAVEDEASVRTLAARILRDHGYTVLTAASGEEALTMARANAGKIDLVLTDVVMPGMSGKELVSQLSAILPRLKALFVSGYTTDAIVHHGILDSGVSFLQKPFSVEGLARKIRDVLDQ